MSDEELKMLQMWAAKELDDLGYVAPEIRREAAMNALLSLLDRVAAGGSPRLRPL